MRRRAANWKMRGENQEKRRRKRCEERGEGGQTGQEDLRRLNKNGVKNRPSDKKMRLRLSLKCGEDAEVKRR